MTTQNISKEHAAVANIHQLNLEHQGQLSAEFKKCFDASVAKAFKEELIAFESTSAKGHNKSDWETRRVRLGCVVNNTFVSVVKELIGQRVLSSEASVLINQEDHYASLLISIEALQPVGSLGGKKRSIVTSLPLWPADTQMEYYDDLSAKTPWKRPGALWKCLVYRAASKISLEHLIESRVKALSKGVFDILNELHHTVSNKPRMGFVPGTLWLDSQTCEGLLSSQFVEKVKSQITKQELEKNINQMGGSVSETTPPRTANSTETSIASSIPDNAEGSTQTPLQRKRANRI